MTTSKGFNKKIIANLLVSIFVVAFAGVSYAAQVHQMANGITATVHSAADITADPSLAGIQISFGDRAWYPFDEALVVNALNAMHGFETDVDVQVYILPAPPTNVGSSFASKSSIYLSPGTGAVDPSTVAYITTHEMGHVLTWAFLDGSAARWDAYLALRGLDAIANGPSASHADRAREILAEDFRYLFGGRPATVNGSIENHDLTLPNRVSGLEELLVDFLASPVMIAAAPTCAAFPNPCNPRTTVALNLPAGMTASAGNARLRIFNLRGALVRTLVGGQLENNQIQIQWDGDNDQGSAVASGRYLYVMQADDLQAKGSVTLVR